MAAKNEEDLSGLDGLLSVTNTLTGDILDADDANKSKSFSALSKNDSSSAMV